jgi:hypothetical protein
VRVKYIDLISGGNRGAIEARDVRPANSSKEILSPNWYVCMYVRLPCDKNLCTLKNLYFGTVSYGYFIILLHE